MKKRLAALLALTAVIATVLLTGCETSTEKKFSSVDDYKAAGVKIGASLGSCASLVAKEEFPDAELIAYTCDEDAYLAVQQGKIDAYVYDDVLLMYAARSLKGLSVVDSALKEIPVCFGLSQSSTELCGKVNAFLAEMKADGTLEDMVTRWITNGETEIPDIAKPENPTEKLVVGTSGIVAPFTFYQGNELTGFDIELVKRFALYLNVDLEIQIMNYDSLIAGLESEKLDLVAANLNYTDERAQKILYSDSYMDDQTTLLVRTSDYGGETREITETDETADAPQTKEELLEYAKGKKVGMIVGYSFDIFAADAFPESELLYYANVSDMVEALRGGKIDVALTDEFPSMLYAQNNNGALIAPRISLKDDEFAIAMKKDNTELAAKINSAIAKLKENGEIDAIVDRWANAETTGYTMPEIELTGENGTLTIATIPDGIPFTYVVDNEQVGADMEMTRRICAELGYNLEIMTMDFSAVIPAIESGKCDMGVTTITKTPERAELVLFSDTYYTSGVMELLRCESTKSDSGDFLSNIVDSFTRTFITENRWQLVLQGLAVTAIISVGAAIFGTILGFILCFMRMAKSAILRGISYVFVRIMQGTPIVVMLMILYYLVFGNTPAIIVAIVGFAMSFGAYVSEMIRTGIKAVDSGQQEAAYAMGFSKRKTFRMFVLPQAAQHFLPVYRGEFISMIKMTSVVGYIAVQDLTKASDIIRSRTYEAFFPLIATAVIYFTISWLLALIISKLDKRMNSRTKKAFLKGVDVNDTN